MTISSFRDKLLLLLIACYLVLNYGMMLLRIPPGGNGLPLGEVIIIFYLLTIHYPSSIPRLSSVYPASLLCLWWAYVLLRGMYGASEYGLWAFRDATNVLESVFILVGFIFAKKPENINKFFNWLNIVLIVACVYGLTYPAGDFLQAISPKLSGGSGQTVALIGAYTNSPVMLLWASFTIMIYLASEKGMRWRHFLLSACLIGFTLAVYQARTIYLQIVAIFFFFYFSRRDLLNRNIVLIVLCLVTVSFFPFWGIKIYGRIGQEVSVDFFYKHFMAIFGIANEGVEQAASGVMLRTDWWASIFRRLFSSFSNIIIGLGYGFPLIDYHVTGGISVREPHNSYISFIARSGLIGLSFFGWVHYKLIQVWFSAYKKCEKLSWQAGSNQLIVLMVYFILIWVFAIGEDAFEKPFNAIPYYFFWGVVLRFAYHLKMGNIGPKDIPHQSPARP